MDLYIYINIYINKIIKNIKYNIVCASDSGDILLIVKSGAALLPGIVRPPAAGEQGIPPGGSSFCFVKGFPDHTDRLVTAPANPCRPPECDIKVITQTRGVLPC